MQLVCVRSGKRTIWRRASKGSTTTTAPATATTPITPQCVSLLVQALTELSNPAAGIAAVMQSILTCQVDTGKTAVLTAVPFRLQDIASITKFRSCVGHDYSEGSSDGQATSTDPAFEKFRSMKHYIRPIADNPGDQTPVFAPFNGVVGQVAPDLGLTSDGSTFADPGDQIHLVPDANPDYDFTFMHVSGVTVKAGDRIQAGEQLGYYQVPPGFTPGVGTFDLVVSQYKVAALMQGAVLKFSFMNFLAPPVAASFAAAGLTPDTLVWPRAYRDAHPCQMTGQRGFFVSPPDPADTVTLTR